MVEANRDEHNGLEGLFTGLEAGYQALLSREEDAAASDLALSLLQDRPLPRALLCSGPLTLLHGGANVPVSAVGPDYVVLADRRSTIVPLARTGVFAHGNGAAPAARSQAFVQVIRRFVRDRCHVRVTTAEMVLEGPALFAGRDHIALQTLTGRVLASYAAVVSISSDPSRTADET